MLWEYQISLAPLKCCLCPLYHCLSEMWRKTSIYHDGCNEECYLLRCAAASRRGAAPSSETYENIRVRSSEIGRSRGPEKRRPLFSYPSTYAVRIQNCFRSWVKWAWASITPSVTLPKMHPLAGEANTPLPYLDNKRLEPYITGKKSRPCPGHEAYRGRRHTALLIPKLYPKQRRQHHAPAAVPQKRTAVSIELGAG
jgi:hypothetical protein